MSDTQEAAIEETIMEGLPTSTELSNEDGYLLDYISGMRVKSTPEERDAVQVFARQLVEDYGYGREYITTRPQWRVKARPSDTTKEYPVDIAIFNSTSKSDDSLSIIVECKKKNRKDGRTQLEDYLRLSKAKLGVWFNGDERFFLKKIEKNGTVLFEEIPNIPQFGQRLEDIGYFLRKDLRAAHNLKVIFRAIRSHLAGNAVGTTRDEVLAQQLINLIFCKIYDEKFTKPDEVVTFRAGVDESSIEIADRIKLLFNSVKAKYTEVIDFNDTISLDDKSIKYIVGELQNYCITDAERDVVADAFETFIGYALKGGQGQFFTPRNVVNLMVNIVDPQPDELIIDPACGSGGFLVESLKHMWSVQDKQAEEFQWSDLALKEEKLATAIHNIHGIEKDDFLSKVTKAYMAIMGDGKGGIFCEDSLELPVNWKPKTRQLVELGKFDVVLANPPFGKDIKIVGDEKLKQYDLSYKWVKSGDTYTKTNKLNNEMQPQILFIERCLQLLRDGGRLGIVLPETFFHAPNMQYVMRYMQKHNIMWVVDLPHNTFRPHNNAKCLVLVLQKNTPQQENINMAVAEQMGHDHQGKEIYRWDPITKTINKNEVWDDIRNIISEVKTNNPSKYVFSEKAETLTSKSIFVPRYYWNTKLKQVEEIAAKEGLELVSVKSLIDDGILQTFDGHGSPPSEYKGRGNIAYIRVKDIVNWELYKDPTSRIPEDVYLKKVGKNKELMPADVVYVRRGSYRIGSVAMVSPYDKKVLLTREILVLRVVNDKNKYGITPYYLLYLLSHRLTSMQAYNKVLIETTLPNIANRWQELLLPVHKDEQKRKEISNSIKEVIENKWNAIKGIEEIKDKLGDITT
ncbi:MAG: N-6 DNA methylase [Candidatus Microsaccharimonas sp.]